MIKKKIGLIVNPISGMGGSVGLKGTDGDILKKALEMGAKPVAPKRLDILLSQLKNHEDLFFLAAPGKMGAEMLKNKDFKFEIVGEICKDTSAEDTKRIAKQMLEKNIDLLIFCGGDGTARDIFDAIQLEVPVIAIPSGVKMFSSIFAINPRAAAEMIESFIEGTDTIEKEVLDINEDAFREGKLQSRLYGYLKVPQVEKLLQGGKQSSKAGKTIQENKNEIAKHIIENMRENVLYLLGPGTTVKSISDSLGVSKALLGIDAIYNKKLVASDINEREILDLLEKYKVAEIIVSPIGGQGFILGRGNKQFTPEVLKKIGKDNITVVSTEDKIKELMCLRVDTGDIELDNILIGHKKVIVGYNEFLLIELN
ncbi:MAG: ATP-NAD kinase [Promethearchaeota archaeon]|nr:MAG: ATP-NAD kinase [Candidatus Lokiarchaeota archaeon]